MFAAAFAALFSAHQVADYWLQTQHQANTKGQPGWAGRFACARHVASYTAAQAGALAAVCAATGARPRAGRVAAALAVSAATHYAADRRAPLRRLADAIGKDPGWLDNGGLAHLDQSWHIGWVGVAALLLADRQAGR